MRRFGATAVLLLLAGPAHGQAVIRGPVEAVPDGGTLVVAGTHVRLWGIRPLALEQECADVRGHRYPCGKLAALLLDLRTRGLTVECRLARAGSEEHPMAQCLAGSMDLARLQVLAGLAIDHPAESGGHYQPDQTTAGRRRTGLWLNPQPWPFGAPVSAD